MPPAKHMFHNHLFSFDEGTLALHENLMTCVILGKQQPVIVSTKDAHVEAEIISIRPGVPHSVIIKAGGADIVYLDGVQLAPENAAIESLPAEWRALSFAFHRKSHEAIIQFRALLQENPMPADQTVMKIVERLYADPMTRLSQLDLATELDLERTQALRHFKATTGQTFRKFKIWAAIVAATRNALNGAQIGHAGVDAGFSDAAHLARTASIVFGTTPTNGLSKLRGMQTLVGARP